MKEELKELLGDMFIILCGGWFLFTFVVIWLFGGITYIEPNRTILAAEIIASTLIMILGVERLKKDIKKEDKEIGSE